MKTVRRLLYRDIVASVAFVSLAFLSLFYFIDFVEEIDKVGRGGVTVWTAAWSSLLVAPGHLYELLPITVLIGTIYSMARLAQSSEFTILRTAGLGPLRALGLLAALGLAFSVFTFMVGDYLAPFSEQQAVLLKAKLSGGLQLGRSGAWLKEKRAFTDGEHSYSVNVASAGPNGVLYGVRIFEFDPHGRMMTRVAARSGVVLDDERWTLSDAEVTRWPQDAGSDQAHVDRQRMPTMDWPSTLKPNVVAAAVLPLATMTTLDLWRYSIHLSDQEQAAQRYQIQFWKKALYPLACLVMVALALPFAYLHARAGGVSLKVFGGIMLGISFVLLNNVAGQVGLMNSWTPWLVAATPSALYLLISMAAFAWLVRYR